jgi:hypothetical protein
MYRAITRFVRHGPAPLSIVMAIVVSCCVTAPPAALAVAHLALSAAAGLGVGVLVVVTICLLRCSRPTASALTAAARPARSQPGAMPAHRVDLEDPAQSRRGDPADGRGDRGWIAP